MHSLQKYEVEPINCQKSELAETDHMCVKRRSHIKVQSDLCGAAYIILGA